jgi:NTE family protein
MTAHECKDDRCALVLTGGGARAAYQVGVLAAIADLIPDGRKNPFPIICGTSAGAINAAALACGAENYRGAVDALRKVWGRFHAGQVYRADPAGIAWTGCRWLGALMVGWLIGRAPRSLLDNRPLEALLRRKFDFPGIDRAISSGALYAVSITASGYASGTSVSFFQARSDVGVWERSRRKGARVRLAPEHLLASSAIPFVFPSVRVHREHFGDGSMRQLAPLSPAVHLGATRILVIGAGRVKLPGADPRIRQVSSPSLAQVAGHALSSIFLDSIDADVEHLERINRMLDRARPADDGDATAEFRKIRSLSIMPSQPIDGLAAKHARALPWAVRLLLSGVGAMNRRGGALTSYLLFEQPYTQALIELGYADAMAQSAALREFIAPTAAESAA